LNQALLVKEQFGNGKFLQPFFVFEEKEKGEL